MYRKMQNKTNNLKEPNPLEVVSKIQSLKESTVKWGSSLTACSIAETGGDTDVREQSQA
jgi:hypothetical protein